MTGPRLAIVNAVVWLVVGTLWLMDTRAIAASFALAVAVGSLWAGEELWTYRRGRGT